MFKNNRFILLKLWTVTICLH